MLHKPILEALHKVPRHLHGLPSLAFASLGVVIAIAAAWFALKLYDDPLRRTTREARQFADASPLTLEAALQPKLKSGLARMRLALSTARSRDTGVELTAPPRTARRSSRPGRW